MVSGPPTWTGVVVVTVLVFPLLASPTAAVDVSSHTVTSISPQGDVYDTSKTATISDGVAPMQPVDFASMGVVLGVDTKDACIEPAKLYDHSGVISASSPRSKDCKWILIEPKGENQRGTISLHITSLSLSGSDYLEYNTGHGTTPTYINSTDLYTLKKSGRDKIVSDKGVLFVRFVSSGKSNFSAYYVKGWTAAGAKSKLRRFVPSDPRCGDYIEFWRQQRARRSKLCPPSPSTIGKLAPRFSAECLTFDMWIRQAGAILSEQYGCTLPEYTIDGRPCSPVFEYRDKQYTGCTNVDWHTLWCRTELWWGECEPKTHTSTDVSAHPNKRLGRRSMNAIGSIKANFTQIHKEHHTDYFRMKDKKLLVTRRGQHFDLAVSLKHKISDEYHVQVYMDLADQMVDSQTPPRALRSGVPQDKSEWGVSSLTSSPQGTGEQFPFGTAVRIHIPVTAGVGSWSLSVELVEKASGARVAVASATFNVAILFNPWVPEDDAYLEDEDMLDNFLLRESGLIFVGEAKELDHRPWAYDQFNQQSLEASLAMLGPLHSSHRNASSSVSRFLTWFINNAVLEGRWDPPFTEGKKPTYWTGSAAILKLWMEKGAYVQFGQCWVFAGLVATVYRSLGLPSRVVTGFEVAHEAKPFDGNVDRYWHKEGSKYTLDEYGLDSVWNFHVWNEVWMKRSDIVSHISTLRGWQVADATPQETSDGLYQLGPAPLNLVKDMEFNGKYDTAFVISEVNANIRQWVRTGKKEEHLLYSTQTNAIGVMIATDAYEGSKEGRTLQRKRTVGAREEWFSVLDITENYKRVDESLSELMLHSEVSQSDVDFEIIQPNVWTVGNDAILLSLKMSSNGDGKRKLFATIGARVIHDNGKFVASLQDYSVSIELSGSASTTANVTLDSDDFLRHISHSSELEIAYSVEVEETSQLFLRSKRIRLDIPKLAIEVSNDSIHLPSDGGGDGGGSQSVATVAFTNPLAKPLSDVVVSVHVTGTDYDISYTLSEPLKPGERTVFPVIIPPVPPLIGTKGKWSQLVVATLSSEELNGVYGCREL